jgi:hypothetical protein
MPLLFFFLMAAHEKEIPFFEKLVTNLDISGTALGIGVLLGFSLAWLLKQGKTWSEIRKLRAETEKLKDEKGKLTQEVNKRLFAFFSG